MQYLVKRGEAQYGPYSLAELQEYSQSGRVLGTDMAKSEGLVDWVPVSQILGNIPVPIAAPVAVAPQIEPVPLAPNLHWAILLVLIFVGNLAGILGTVFLWIWSMVMGNWARRLNGNSTPLILAAIWPMSAFCGGLAIGFSKTSDNAAFSAVGYLLILFGFVVGYVSIFKVRAAMEEYYNSKENIALTLSGVMTFFFTFVYLQYHVNRIARWKKTGILS
jgi:hypothetical protein